MRIGIVSDIHGNARGLALALERMGTVDELLCAGVMVEEFRFSNETVEILRDRDAKCVLGNHDLGMLAPHGGRARSASGWARIRRRSWSGWPQSKLTTS